MNFPTNRGEENNPRNEGRMKVFIPAVYQDLVDVFEVQCLARSSPSEEILVTGKVDASIIDSIQVAISILSYNTLKLRKPYHNKKYHFHFTDGSFAKEGTSAGLGIALSLLQAVGYELRCYDKLSQVLVTGEIDLYGDVYPIGGIEMKATLLKECNFDAIITPDQPMPDIGKDITSCQIIKVSNIIQLIQDKFDLDGRCLSG